MRALLPAALLTLVAACSGGSQGWSSPADCEALSAGADADECWARFAPDVFRDDPARGIALVEERVSDPHVRDFIWLAVTRDVDMSSYQYCDRIQEPALARRCREIVSRPHLQRDVLKAGEDGAPPTSGRPSPESPSAAPAPSAGQ